MKLFGGRKDKHRGSGADRYDRNSAVSDAETADSNVPQAPRAVLYLVAAAVMFVLSLILIFSLIRKSGNTIELPKQESSVLPLNYQVNVSAPIIVDTEIEVEPLISKYGSERMNILIVVPNDQSKTADAVILLSLDLKNSTVSLLSVPRDTYIAGNYEEPKIRNVFHSAESGKKGAEAVREMLRGMMGFQADHYIVLDQDALAVMVDQSEEVRFTVPSEPAFSTLPAGERVFRGSEAIRMFSYQNGYTDVETAPARVQRQFLQELLMSFTKGEDAVLAQRSSALYPKLVTDLNEKQLTYLAIILRGMDLYAAFSRALPGGEIEIDEVLYYQVATDDAIDMLNEQFSPLDTELDEFDVNFRQLTGASGDGEYSDYGFSDSTEETADPNDTEESGDEATDSEDTQEPDEPDVTEEPDSSEDPDDTENTEEPSEVPSDDETTETP